MLPLKPFSTVTSSLFPMPAATATAAPTVAPSVPPMLNNLMKRADLIFTGALFGTVLLLIVPVPPFLLDMLLALSIGMSLLVMLVIVYVKDPPEFTGFPTILLGLTLYR